MSTIIGPKSEYLHHKQHNSRWYQTAKHGASGLLVVLIISVSCILFNLVYQAQTTQHAFHPLCPPVTTSVAACSALILEDSSGAPAIDSSPAGHSPGPSAHAFTFHNMWHNANATIGIVTAYDTSRVERDLAVYRKALRLSPCSSSNKCFHRVAQYGTHTRPQHNKAWSAQAALDVDMASYMCPRCRILLVEAYSDRFSDLQQAADRAARMGSTAISSSYYRPMQKGKPHDPKYLTVLSATSTTHIGNTGYSVEFPPLRAGHTAVLQEHEGLRLAGQVVQLRSRIGIVTAYDSSYGAGWVRFIGFSALAPIIAATYAKGSLLH